MDRNKERKAAEKVKRGRSPQGSVDRNFFDGGYFRDTYCRSPQGSVDRNTVRDIDEIVDLVAPRRGAWIEITDIKIVDMTTSCRSPQGSVDRNDFDIDHDLQPPSRSPQGSVDRNSDDLTDRLMVDVAPRRGAWIEIL